MTTPTTPAPAGDVREIVERLRGLQRAFAPDFSLPTEAAAALERLAGDRDGVEFLHGFEMAKLRQERDAALKERDEAREEKGHLVDAWNQTCLERDTERAARERAEAALREIAVPPAGGNWDAEGHSNCVEIARAALQPQPQPQGGGDE